MPDQPLRLSVLDQSPIPAGSSPTDALANTVDLAQLAERLGYTRYWLAEHHGTGGLAGSSPEVVIAHVAALTSSIRVGSGGVMLPHYSPLKVAEQFRTLAALHPGRIDLGIGRAPGAEGLTTLALQRNRRFPILDDFEDQMGELVAWLEDAFPDGHGFQRLRATPVPDTAPELWLLSSSGYSAQAAAEIGAGFCFAHFISQDGGTEAIARYRQAFERIGMDGAPRAAVAVSVICADTTAEAEVLASSSRLWRYRQRRLGERGPVPSVEEAAAYHFEPNELALAQANAQRTIVGGPDEVHTAVEELATRYGVDEVVVVTITHDHGARRRSYELLAKSFDLLAP